GNVVSVSADSTGVYIGWFSTEGPYALIKRTPDGSRGLWGKADFGTFAGPNLLAMDSKSLYAYVARSDSLFKVDPANGATLKTVQVNTGRSGDDNEPLTADDDSVTYNFSKGLTASGIKGL